MTRAVLDTVILVRALINPYSVWGNVVFDSAGEYVHVVSLLVVEEYLEVLQRPVLTRKYRMVTGRDFLTILELLEKAEIVEIEEPPAVSRDSKDDIFIATAMAGDMNMIVTEDHDLLVLNKYGDIPIVTASAFLKRLRGAKESV